jgi:hypothetical protein
MNPLRSFKGTVYGYPYPTFACGCGGFAECGCNAGVGRTITQAELLAEAERTGQYPLRLPKSRFLPATRRRGR